MYKVYETENFKFYIKFDLIDGKPVPHIYHRHSVTPEDAIKTFFNITSQNYNPVNMRYEAYSDLTNITIYYAFRHNTDNEILIITAI